MDTVYYKISDTTKIDSFLSIPKMLFIDPKYKKLSIPAKMIYSLYLNRYSITKYQDKQGPYIIYNDKDIVDKLKINRSTCSRARNELIEVGLINTKRGVGNNKIYLYNYNKENLDKAFYYEEDLTGYQFYRFPVELFDKTFENLSLKTKLIYSIYFDTMCLSQMNYFVDEKERIYFQESGETQEKKIGLTKKTILDSKNILKVCGLLLEHKPFAQDSRFYLLKLTNFIDRVEEYKKIDNKKEYIKKVCESIKQELIVKQEKRNYTIIKKLRTELGLTQSKIVDIINENLDISLNLSAYKNYELGRRNFPDRIYEFLYEYLVTLFSKNDTSGDTILVEKEHIEDNEVSLFSNNETKGDIQSENIEQTILKKKNKLNGEIKTNISKTENNYIYSKKTNILLINLINKINTFIYNSIFLEEQQKKYIEAAFDKIKTYQKFYLTKQETLVTSDLLIQYFSIIDTQVVFEKLTQKILNKIEINGYVFETPDNQINCFLTFLINELKDYNSDEVPSWFNNIPGKNKFDYMKTDKEENTNIDTEIKNLKWWD